MALDPKILTSLTRRIEPADYLRVTPWSRRSAPLGMGFGETRFASPTKAFRILYIAEDLATCLAEATGRRCRSTFVLSHAATWIGRNIPLIEPTTPISSCLGSGRHV